MLEQCRMDFTRAMVHARNLFEDHAFRRKRTDGTYAALNRPLFEAVSVNLAQLNAKHAKLLNNTEFITAISNSTAKIGNVRTRHKMIRDMFRRIIEND